jgi:D-aminoacyl-tRNA deacylase
MNIDIIHSSSDIAGSGIRSAMDRLLAHPPGGGWPLTNAHHLTFRTWDDRIIHAPNSVTSPDAGLVIFLARHASVNPVRVLTVHPGGNFGKAELGGNDRELGLSAPAWMRAVLRNHQKFAPEGYRVSYEITHHGPTAIHVPFFFVEVGSTETEWQDKDAVQSAAKSILMASPGEVIPLIGFGGTHYAVRQTAIALETRGAFGHMMHTRDVGCTDAGMVRRMMEQSSAIAAHVDAKALSKQEYAHIGRILSDLAIPQITEGDLRKIGDRPYAVWQKFSRAAFAIDPMFQIFPHGKISDGEPSAVTLPEDLFQAAFSGNEDALFSHLDTVGNVFHTTGKGGKLLPVFFTTAKNRMVTAGDLIALSVQLVTRTYGTWVEDGQITITRQQFDPELARMLGVPSGPLYGKLVSGETVTLPDGSTVSPGMVTRTVQTTIQLPGLENYS